MARITGPDCAVIGNLIITHTRTHTSIIDPPLGASMRVVQNDYDDRAGLRGYVQFNKYTHTHTYTHTLVFAVRILPLLL